MLNYEKLSDEISAQTKNDRENGFVGNIAFDEANVIRGDKNKDKANIIRVDYIASMTDDYFTNLYAYLFPESDLKIIYKGYFK